MAVDLQSEGAIPEVVVILDPTIEGGLCLNNTNGGQPKQAAGVAARAAKANGGVHGLKNGATEKNYQAYDNSGLADSQVSEVLNGLNETLYGRKDPNLAILKEKPEHRIILLLKLKGMSNREIAKEMGYTEPWISQVCRQPWFQTMLTAALSETKEEILDDLVKIEATNSFYKLVQLRDTAKSEDVQKSSAIRILEMCVGKPVQKTEIRGTYEHTLTKVEKINQELEEVEREERRLMAYGTEQHTQAHTQAQAQEPITVVPDAC